jgi:hypothetical protein
LTPDGEPANFHGARGEAHFYPRTKKKKGGLVMAFFFIVCNQGSVVIDIQGASKNPVKPSTPLDTSTQKKSDYDSQLWEIAEPDPQVQQEEPGYCYLRSKLKSTEGKPLIIDIQSKQYASTPMPIQADTQPPASGEAVNFYQVWTFVPGPAGYYYIQSLLSPQRGNPPLVIEIKDGDQNPGTLLQVNSKKTKDSAGGNDYQLWKLVDEKGEAVAVPKSLQTSGSS